ncbi:hypothetical protein E2562_019996 [Oryza meyeriana var. granulata]|uniref:Uncharacterized protein n=1 Tax=Oryza meyeriana var. granulata TaxID=110450 RepID=A0A6G1CID4_9ORYZ|nr:hypothetical protein E2562_019995 [Oryza meyeriana var. granulata]KAF0899514.1 hypothetical protein E2562_019996 [Oryza meyeriana var. granulata]
MACMLRPWRRRVGTGYGGAVQGVGVGVQGGWCCRCGAASAGGRRLALCGARGCPETHQLAFVGDSKSVVVDFIGNGKNEMSSKKGIHFSNSFNEIQDGSTGSLPFFYLGLR